MATAQEVIKNFMSSLDSTSYYGTTALNTAIRASSSFRSWQQLINKMVSDCESYDGGGDAFLREKCGIVLSNTDTGAITGYDAGAGTVKTAESVVPETGSFVSPTTSTSTFYGLTVNWPRGSLTSAQKTIVAGLNTWWIPNALKLIQESYGLTFEGDNATVKSITVKFVNNNNNTLAYVENSSSSFNGGPYQATRLTLNINLKYYNNISSTDVNGKSSSTSTYLDRTIAHELTHAIMAATVNNFNYLPTCFSEGIAELTHGIDDERKTRIEKLASNSSVLNNALSGEEEDSTDPYAAGYMLLRYFAYQSSDAATAETLPSGDTVPAGTEILTLTEDKGLLASTGTKPVVLIAGGSGDTLDGGVNNTADTLLSAGSGKNTTFFLHINGGDDVAIGFVFGGDKDTDDVVALDGSFENVNLITPGNGTVKIGSDSDGSLTLIGDAAQNEFAYNYGGNLGIVSLDMSAAGMKMSFDPNANLYVGQGKGTSLVFDSDDFIAGTGDNGSFAGFGWNSKYISDGLGVIDGRRGLVAAINGDNSVNQLIYASTVVGASSDAAGNEVFLCGGLGDNFSNPTVDTLVGSANGNTTFYVGRKMGNDVLQNAVGGDKVVFIDTKTTDLASFSSTGNTFSASFTDGATIKLNASADITDDNGIIVQFDDVTYTWNGSTLK